MVVMDVIGNTLNYTVERKLNPAWFRHLGNDHHFHRCEPLVRWKSIFFFTAEAPSSELMLMARPLSINTPPKGGTLPYGR